MSQNRANAALRLAGAFLIASGLIGAPVFAQGTAVITGTVVDASTKNPIPDVAVTATAPTLQGEQVVVTDAAGVYRIPQLPSGAYTLRYEAGGYKPFQRANINVRQDVTVRVNVELLPEALTEDITVQGTPPTIDVGSTTTGVNVSSEFIRNIAVVNPGARGGAARSFESLAIVAPGSHSDLYGVSINGTTSPENQYVIDGLSVNDPGFGLNATPLTVEFVQEVNVITGGYMPEYGRATGGVMSVVTKSGSNEFHGSVWGNVTPGLLEGDLNNCGQTDSWGFNCGRVVRRNGTTVQTNHRLWGLGDIGAELGGPIMKDKLWFYAGFAPSYTRRTVERQFYTWDIERDANGNPLYFGGSQGRGAPLARASGGMTRPKRDELGFAIVNPIEGTRQEFFAAQRSFQYIGKLTYLINQDHSLSLSVYGTPTSSGGRNGDEYIRFGIDPQDGAVEVGNMVGNIETLARRYTADSMDISLKLASSFMDKRLLFDTTAGWHRQYGAIDPNDMSEIGGSEGLAGVPAVTIRRHAIPFVSGGAGRNFHSLRHFVQGGEIGQRVQEACELDDPTRSGRAFICPVTGWALGGPGFIGHDDLNRWQGKTVATYLLNALGHHVIKAGIDLEYMDYAREKAYSGLVIHRQSTNGTYFDDIRRYAYLSAPDVKEDIPLFTSESASFTYGGFIQDSWNVLDLVTLNIGVRYDSQQMYGNNASELALSLGNQVSPRIGLVYDFTQQGRSKIFANYARFYENALLDMIDRQFPGERQIYGIRGSIIGYGNTAVCDPLNDPNWVQNCRNENTLGYTVLGTPDDPNQRYLVTGGDQSPVDPDLQPQSSDEIVVGGEYEVFTDARAGISYTKRYMNAVIEDMSRDEATTYFIGNPGMGIAEKGFPRATRDYDAVTLYLNKNFSDLWLAQASYTWSRLYGNYAGLFRPETGQLDPNINSDFDLQSLTVNRTGFLPGDRTHSFKIFGAKEFVFGNNMSMNIGLTYTLRSGSPLNALGGHAIYGADEVFLLPRGTVGRNGWINNVDSHIGFNYRISKDSMATFSVDIFNVFNLQAATARDQRFVNEVMEPIVTKGATVAQLREAAEEVGALVNPNFGNPTAYQAARSIRFGAKFTF